jgi:hypothetical protein
MDWAAHTSRIRLGIAVVVTPYLHPLATLAPLAGTARIAGPSGADGAAVEDLSEGSEEPPIATLSH